jgi:rfaE bifunctional protein nucleotidyltransferase chain/domain
VTPFAPLDRVMSWTVARAWRERHQGTVVFTNGVFDLLHPGHIDVGINSDASVQRLKGPSRPIRTAADRAYVLAALAAVDCVTVFEQDTPLELIRALEPDVIVKGGDYSPLTVVGAAETRARGGSVVIIPLTPGHSTTATIAKLRSGPADV